MTAEEQKIYDEGVSKARSVADAMKQHRHDQEVFAFAKDLSDNVIGGLNDGGLSASGAPGKSRRLSLQGHGCQGRRQDAARRRKGFGTVWCDDRRPGVRPRSCCPWPGRADAAARVAGQRQHTSPSTAYLRQTVRTNEAAVVAEGAIKPTSVYAVPRCTPKAGFAERATSG